MRFTPVTLAGDSVCHLALSWLKHPKNMVVTLRFKQVISRNADLMIFTFGREWAGQSLVPCLSDVIGTEPASYPPLNFWLLFS